MDETNIVRDIASLSPEARKLVGDFVTFLKNRSPQTSFARKTRKTKLDDEPFIGMWEGRVDMRDSAEWVRDMRTREWGPVR